MCKFTFKKLNKLADFTNFLAFFQFLFETENVFLLHLDPHTDCRSGSRGKNKCGCRSTALAPALENYCTPAHRLRNTAVSVNRSNSRYRSVRNLVWKSFSEDHSCAAGEPCMCTAGEPCMCKQQTWIQEEKKRQEHTVCCIPVYRTGPGKSRWSPSRQHS